MKRIRVTPTPGTRILDPFDSNKEVPATGKNVVDETYWRRRAREGGVVISEAVKE